MDASKQCSGAALAFRPTWKTTWPVAFNSSTFKNTELNYPVQEKEFLAIIRALNKWWSEVFGCSSLIYTDHKTLENFAGQKDLSSRQACWMEFISQFNAKVIYIRGKDNSVADSLHNTPLSMSLLWQK